MIFELHHPPGPGPLVLGALTGAAEMAVSAAGASDAIALIDALIQPRGGAPVAPGEAASMTVSDRDRLMATLYRLVYGGRISGVSQCHGCGERFDFDFELDALLGSIASEPAEPEADGWFRDGDARFRLPTGADELAAQGRAAAQAAGVIALRCAPDADAAARARIEARVARIAPLVDLTLRAACPQCGAENPMRFGAERYFLTALRNERPRLMREVHLLGATYHWPLDEILSLTREDRRALADQIARDRDAARKAGAA